MANFRYEASGFGFQNYANQTSNRNPMFFGVGSTTTLIHQHKASIRLFQRKRKGGCLPVAKIRELGIYVARHHIHPTCLHGGGKLHRAGQPNTSQYFTMNRFRNGDASE